MSTHAEPDEGRGAEASDGDGGPELAIAVQYCKQGRDLTAARRDSDAIAVYRRALPHAEQAVADGMGPHTDLVVFLSHVHDMLGYLHLRQSDLSEADHHFTRALTLTRSVTPSDPRVAKFLSNLGSVAKATGDLAGAMRRYREAVEHAADIGMPVEAVAPYISNFGTVLLALGAHEEALALFRHALQSDEHTDSSAAAVDLSLIASVLVEIGDIDGARANYEKALAIHRAEDPGSPETAHDLLNLGYVHRLRGQLEEALRHYLAALAIDRGLGPDSLETATDLNNVAFIYKERGDLESARHYAEAAAEISGRRAPLSPRAATHLLNLGAIHLDLGRRDDARAAFERALAIDQAVAPHSLETARDLNNLASLADDDGDRDLAEWYWRQALRIYQTAAPGSHHCAIGYSNLGVAAYRRGHKLAAALHFQTALELDRRLLPDSETTIVDLVNLAVLHESDGDLDTAVRLFGEATEIAERLRLWAGPPRARDDRFARDRKLFRNLVHALVRRGLAGDDAAAFDAAERARARGLADLLSFGAALRAAAESEDAAGIHGLLAEEERAYRDLLAVQRRLLGDHPADADPALRRPAGDTGGEALRRRGRELRESLERTRLRLNERYPGYAAISGRECPSLQELQETLDESTTMLVFHIGVARSIGWAVRRDGHLSVPIPLGEARLRELVDRALSSCRRAGAPGEEDLRAAAELASALLEPAAGSIVRGQSLVVVAEGPLLYLPFEILPFKGRLLADWAVVSYCPSTTVFAALTASCANTRRPYLHPFVGFGLDGHGAPSAVGLPGSREVVEIAKDYGADAVALTGAAANRAAVHTFGANAAVVHFSTHGVLDDAEPMFSGLRLGTPEPAAASSLDEAGSQNADDVLRVYEMFGLDLNAAVVVCSACETGLGRLHAGEGLLSMSRALFHAGARCLVVSLWPVPDTPTRRLMRAFHASLRQGDPPALALSGAKTQVRESHPRVYRDPWTWAGFIALGHGGLAT